MTLIEAEKILEQRNLPGTPQETATLVRMLENLVQEKGLDWVKRHREALVAQWELTVAQGVLKPKISPPSNPVSI